MDDSIATEPYAALTLKRVFNAPIARVFEAWTDADCLVSWFAPTGYTVTSAKVDLAVGGEFQIVVQPPGGEAVKHHGQYLEITPPRRLVFTWVLDGQACSGNTFACADTLVSIDFRPVGLSTEIVLLHERLPNKQAYDGHAFGWQACLDSYDNFLRTTISR